MSNIDKQALREAAVAIETFRVKVTTAGCVGAAG